MTDLPINNFKHTEGYCLWPKIYM